MLSELPSLPNLNGPTLNSLNNKTQEYWEVERKGGS